MLGVRSVAAAAAARCWCSLMY